MFRLEWEHFDSQSQTRTYGRHVAENGGATEMAQRGGILCDDAGGVSASLEKKSLEVEPTGAIVLAGMT